MEREIVQDMVRALRNPKKMGFTVPPELSSVEPKPHPGFAVGGLGFAYKKQSLLEPLPHVSIDDLELENRILEWGRATAKPFIKWYYGEGLLPPGCIGPRFGGWIDGVDGHIYIEIVEEYEDVETAMTVARERKEIAIYDLDPSKAADQREIRIDYKA
jgi:hypothetical protein